MISVSNASASQAGSYYLQRDPILDKPGEWQGNGCESLGLSGDVKPFQFAAVTSGMDPQTAEQLIPDGGHEHTHRAGTDYTFSAPKDVSVAALVIGDERVLVAHETAVSKTLEYAEGNFSQVRETKDGTTSRINTDSMVAAKFTHAVSREGDPNLHTHCVVANMSETKDGWKAVSNEEMYKNRSLLDVYYKNELTHELQKSGIKAEMVTDGKGVTDVKIEGMEQASQIFSKRSNQIEEKSEELRQSGKMEHASDARLREIANKDTRQGKTSLSGEELKAKWGQELAENGISLQKMQADIKGQVKDQEPNIEKSAPNEKEIIRAIVFATTEEKSSFTKPEIIKSGLKVSAGTIEGKKIEAAWNNLKKEGEIKEIKQPKEQDKPAKRPTYTTPEAQKAEKDIERAKNKYAAPLMDKKEASEKLDRFEKEVGIKLNDEQRNQLKTFMTSNKSVSIISVPKNASNLKITKTAAKEKRIEHEARIINLSQVILGNKSGMHIGYTGKSDLFYGDSYKGIFGDTYSSKKVLTGKNAGTKMKSKSHAGWDGSKISETTISKPGGGTHQIKSREHGNSFYSIKTTSEKIIDANGNVALKTSRTMSIMGFKFGKSTTTHENGKIVERNWRGHDTSFLGQKQLKITHDESIVKSPSKLKFSAKLGKSKDKKTPDPPQTEKKDRFVIVDINTPKKEMAAIIKQAEKDGSRVVMADKKAMQQELDKLMTGPEKSMSNNGPEMKSQELSKSNTQKSTSNQMER